MAKVIFEVEPEYARKRKREAAGVLLTKFRSAAGRAKDAEVERAWLEASAGMQRTVARVEGAIRFRQFPPLTRAYVQEFPREAGRIRELRGEYHRESRGGWAGKELLREQLLRVACART
jgi:hypothetical protein